MTNNYSDSIGEVASGRHTTWRQKWKNRLFRQFDSILTNSARREDQRCTRHTVPLSVEAGSAISIISDMNADIMDRLDGIKALHLAALDRVAKNFHNKRVFFNLKNEFFFV